MKKHIPYALAVITLLIGFYGGLKYQQNKTLASRNFGGQDFQNLTPEQRQQMRGAGGFAGQGGASGGSASGEILSKDDKSITVKLRDGGSKIIFLSDKTTIGKTTEGGRSDLEVGKTVIVNGTPNSDGSVSADNIQIRPNMATATPTAAQN